MKKNLYFRTVLRRRSLLKEKTLNFLLKYASAPRMLLEVFIRRKFGRRYFSFYSALMLAAIMIGVVKAYMWVESVISFLFPRQLFAYKAGETEANMPPAGPDQLFWFYAFLGAFLLFSAWRQLEITNRPNRYDFDHFSLSSGEFNPWVLRLCKVVGITNVRYIETYVEPGLVLLLAAVVDSLFDLNIAYFLMLMSLFYSLSYMAAYEIGDNFVMDKVDERICNEELERAFVEGLDSSQTRGVRFYGRAPSDQNTRRKMAESFVSDVDDGVEVE